MNKYLKEIAAAIYALLYSILSFLSYMGFVPKFAIDLVQQNEGTIVSFLLASVFYIVFKLIPKSKQLNE